MKEVIAEFDIYLSKLNLRFEAVIIGGAALNILDISSRKTRDVDCLDPEIPADIKNASKQFAKDRPDLLLGLDWLNNGPATLKTDLPSHWKTRTKQLFCGEAIQPRVFGARRFIENQAIRIL